MRIRANIRAKFLVHYVSKSEPKTPYEVVHMYPVTYSEENKSFARDTPNGQLILTVTNPDCFGFWKVGEEYYIDFQPCKPDDMVGE